MVGDDFRLWVAMMNMEGRKVSSFLPRQGRPVALGRGYHHANHRFSIEREKRCSEKCEIAETGRLGQKLRHLGGICFLLQRGDPLGVILNPAIL